MLYFWILCLIIQILGILILIKSPWKPKLINILNNKYLLIYCLPLFRLALGSMFIIASYHKILSPYGFSEPIAQYQLLPPMSVNFFALWLPIFELLIGLGIIFTKWNKEFSFLLLVLMVMFIIALSQALGRNLGITCGCFDIEGAQDKTETWAALVRDITFIFPLFWMWAKGKNKFIWNFKS